MSLAFLTSRVEFVEESSRLCESPCITLLTWLKDAFARRGDSLLCSVSIVDCDWHLILCKYHLEGFHTICLDEWEMKGYGLQALVTRDSVHDVASNGRSFLELGYC